MKVRAMFVDDEARVLQGLRRMLRSVRREWDVEFVGSGPDALDALARSPFDVVVSDMRMPGMDGAELLGEVMEQHPQVARIILSGHSKEESVLRCIGPTHQFLSKPCNADLLKSRVTRACSWRTVVGNPKLRELASGMASLPSLPSHFRQIVAELEAASPSVARVGRLVSRDIGMSAKVLQLVNSAFFGFYRHVSGPEQAVSILGLKTIRALAFSLGVFSQYEASTLETCGIEAATRHSVATGAFARAIAKAEGQDAKVVDNAFVGGLLHDVGKFVLAATMPEEYARSLAAARERDVPCWEAEQELFGATHADVGACLLGLWGFPESVVEAAAFHHCPHKSVKKEFGALAAVHVAAALERERSASERIGPAPEVDMAYLGALGLTDRLPAWRASCHEAIEEGKTP